MQGPGGKRRCCHNVFICLVRDYLDAMGIVDYIAIGFLIVYLLSAAAMALRKA